LLHESVVLHVVSAAGTAVEGTVVARREHVAEAATLKTGRSLVIRSRLLGRLLVGARRPVSASVLWEKNMEMPNSLDRRLAGRNRAQGNHGDKERRIERAI
jgi:hypothetical protein